jgi:hypothetical protein
MLECDTKLKSSSLTKKFLWYTNSNFPALAYIHILIVLGNRPAEDHAEKAWDAMGDNYEALVTQARQAAGSEHGGGIGIFFLSYSQAILQAWEAREVLLRQQHKQPEAPPRIVSDVRYRKGEMVSSSENNRGEQPINVAVGMSSTENIAMTSTMSMGMDGDPATRGSQSLIGLEPAGCYPDILGQGIMDVDIAEYWTETDWKWINTEGW